MTPSPTLRRLTSLTRSLRPLDGGAVDAVPAPISESPLALAPSGVAGKEGGRNWDMSEQELYMFDTMGFLRVRNMLSQEQVAEALAAAR